ncbi:MAG: dihydrolipoamide acetyltransferase family protein [Anaerolineaceae bacterium]|nr:dihydrolipoamide acetyltransferase family protein [Anaerolineaceae bacterium]
MALDVFIPKLGQTVEEVTLLEWQAQDGQTVSAGQEIVQVETDKTTFGVEATGDGVLHLGPYKAGDVVPVLTVVAVIGKAGDTFTALPAGPAGDAAPQAEPAPQVPATAQPQVPATAQPQVPAVDGDAERVFISPIARRMAREHGLDVHKLVPTGRGGQRVVAADVEKYLSHSVPVAAPRVAAPAPLPPAPTYPAQAVRQSVPMSGIRKVIAEHMAQSAHTTAPVTLFMELDATNLVRLRSTLKARFQEEWGFAPGYNEILAKAVAVALAQFPYMNARLNGDQIEYLQSVNVGIAVDTGRGLLVPVLKSADQKSIAELGKELRDLAGRTRQGQALPDELDGGTFTITNLGMYEVDGFTPVINYPQTAILGVGQISKQVVPVDGQVQIRDCMVLSLVFDHRLVDGAPAARFLQYLKHLLQEPDILLALLR